jgi:hypothetical protein
MKKIISVFLAAAIAFSLSLGVSAFADTFTTADALLALRAAAGLTELTAEQTARYDLNKDGAITTADALIILRIAAGLSAEAATQPARENLSAADIESLTEYIRIISGKSPAIGNFPAFSNINEVPLLRLLQILIWVPAAYSEFKPDEVYSFNQVAGLTGGTAGSADSAEYGWGYSPQRLEQYFKENFNPAFSLAGYDYKNHTAKNEGALNDYVWDSGKNLIVIYGFNVFGGGGMYDINVTDSHKSGDNYIVYATVTELNNFGGDYGDLEVFSVERFVYTFIRNADDGFSIVSKRQRG